MPRCPHRDRDRLATDPDLERLLDREDLLPFLSSGQSQGENTSRRVRRCLRSRIACHRLSVLLRSAPEGAGRRRRRGREREEWGGCLATPHVWSSPPQAGTCSAPCPPPTSRLAWRPVGTSTSASSGSRNPGGVNAIRLLGNTPGRAVIVADVAKGYAACACGRRAAGDLGAHVAGVAAVAGHCYPVWTRFEGGKGVATSFGECLYTFPAFAPLQMAVAVAATRIPRVQQRALVSAGAASTAWLAASVLWWKRGLSNSWGPPPTVGAAPRDRGDGAPGGLGVRPCPTSPDPDDLVSSG